MEYLLDVVRLCIVVLSPWLLAPLAVALIHYEVTPPLRIGELAQLVKSHLLDFALEEDWREMLEGVVEFETTAINSLHAATPAWAHPLLHLLALLPTIIMVWRLVAPGAK